MLATMMTISYNVLLFEIVYLIFIHFFMAFVEGFKYAIVSATGYEFDYHSRTERSVLTLV